VAAHGTWRKRNGGSYGGDLWRRRGAMWRGIIKRNRRGWRVAKIQKYWRNGVKARGVMAAGGVTGGVK